MIRKDLRIAEGVQYRVFQLAGHRLDSNHVLSNVFFAQHKSQAGTREIRLHDAFLRLAITVEEHAFDAGVIVKVLHVNRARHRAAHVQMEARRTV